MKVLYICHRQHDVHIGGVAEVIQHLPRSLLKLNTEVLLYTQAEHVTSQLLGPEILENGVPHYSGPFLKPRLITFSRELKPILHLCQQQKIDLIHAHGLYRSGYLAMQIHQRLGIPYIITSHSDVLPSNSERIQKSTVQRRCRQILKNAAHVTHLAPLMADASHAIWDTRNKSTLISNGIDLTSLQSLPSLPEKNYLFSLGRLVPEKGFHILIDTFAELIKNGLDISLVIAGTGSAEKELHHQVKQLGLTLYTDFCDIDLLPSKSIIFTGYIRGELKNRLMKQCRLMLFATQPSAWEEPFGIVQIEAMAAGKPLIASDTIATRYLQQLGLQAATVTPHLVTEWSQAISTLLEDDELRQRMGKMNLENAAQFDWNIIAQHYQKVYSRIRVC